LINAYVADNRFQDAARHKPDLSLPDRQRTVPEKQKLPGQRPQTLACMARKSTCDPFAR